MSEELFVNGSNRITIDEYHCYFEVDGYKKKQVWVLDRDLRAVDYLKDHIRRYGNFFVHAHGRNGNLKCVVYQAYHPYGRIEDRNVMLCDGDGHNLTSGNLYVRGESVPANQQRRIWFDQYRIWFKLPCTEAIFFTEYSAELYNILCNTYLASWYVTQGNGKERLYCRIRGLSAPVGFCELVWLYHNGKLNASNLIQSLKDAKSELNKNGLQIDHLRDNPRNNCIHNLFAMSGSDNATKHDRVTRINLPFFFIPVRIGTDFRILLGKIGVPDEFSKYVICHGVKEFLDCIKEFQQTAKESGEMLLRPVDNTQTNCLSQMLEDDGRDYHNGKYNPIEGLLCANDADFAHWTPFR